MLRAAQHVVGGISRGCDVLSRLPTTILPWTARTRGCSTIAGAVPHKQRYEAGAENLVDNVPESADVVVIGGGVAGCSTLYQLAKQGVNNAVLLEKDTLTAGTTWHTAGLVWRMRPEEVEQLIVNVSHQMMTTLEEETDINTGWVNNGGLFLATDKQRMNEFRRSATLGKAWGLEAHVLGPKETKELYPLLNIEGVEGSLYSPADGTIEPAGYCGALTRAAKNRGAKVIEQCRVSGIQVEKDDFGTPRVRAVHTSKGTIKTDCVVNAAGAWAPYLGAMAGVRIPLIPWRHAYVVTERIEGIQGMPNMRDHDASLYCKLQGDSLCIGGYEPNPMFLENDQVAQDFAFSLYELDWDTFMFNIESAFNRLPVLEQTGIKSTVCGPESFTADHKALVGESPEVRGFFLNCGYNSGGMLFSGVSQELAKWIIHGKPDMDMYSFDIRRFSERVASSALWLKQRGHESYAKTYSIVYPHDEPLAARNLRKDALHQRLLDAGCVYQERQGWERPGWFSPEGPAQPLDYDFYGSYDHQKNEPNVYADRVRLDYTFDFPPHHNIIGEECLACRKSVAAFNMSYFGKFYLTGPDAQTAADLIFTNDMQKPAGSTIYTCMLNYRGGVEGDLTVSPLEPGHGSPHAPSFEGRGFYLAVGGAVSQYVWSHLTDVIQDNKYNCHLVDHSDDMVMISVQGPKSRDLLQGLTKTDLSNTAFPFSTHKEVKIAGHDCRAMRLSFVGELGWELHVPNSSAVAMYDAVMAAGKKYNIVNAGYRAIDSLSLEKGYRHWHADLRSDDTPLQAGLGFTCKLKTDVPFIGREALLQEKKNGLQKKLVTLTIDEHVPLLGLEVIYRDGQIVGYTRRGEYGHALQKTLAVGYIQQPEGGAVTTDLVKSGNYQVERLGNLHPATLHTKSPFDPANKRVKGIYE